MKFNGVENPKQMYVDFFYLCYIVFYNWYMYNVHVQLQILQHIFMSSVQIKLLIELPLTTASILQYTTIRPAHNLIG